MKKGRASENKIKRLFIYGKLNRILASVEIKKKTLSNEGVLIRVKGNF